jgi:ribonuclease BN (tRNA processing enzyme)
MYSFLISLQLDPLGVLGPPKRGRRVTILGDTSDSIKMVDIAQ